jgi:hypothetical protein
MLSKFSLGFLLLFFSLNCFAWEPVHDPFLDEIEKAPLQVYEKLIRKKRKEGENFKLPQLKVTFENMRAEIQHILSSYQTLTSDHQRLLQEVVESSQELEKLGFPYTTSILEINAYVRLVDFLNFREFESIFLPIRSNKPLSFRDILGRETILKNQTPYRMGAIYDLSKTARSIYSLPLENFPSDRDLPIGSGWNGDYAVTQMLGLDFALVIPSYESLKIDFYNKTAMVPFFVARIIPGRVQWDDQTNKTKKQFFIDDLAHGYLRAHHLCMVPLPGGSKPLFFETTSTDDFLETLQKHNELLAMFIRDQEKLAKTDPALAKAVSYLLYHYYVEGLRPQNFDIKKFSGETSNVTINVQVGAYRFQEGPKQEDDELVVQLPRAAEWMLRLKRELDESGMNRQKPVSP